MPPIFTMAENKSTEGLPMYVESLLTPAEWKENMKKYPSTCHLTYDYAHREKPNTFKWRKGMGAVIPLQERENYNKNLDLIFKNAGLKQNS